MNLGIKLDVVESKMKEKGWKPADVARKGKVSKAVISRALNKKRGPTETLVAGLLTAFPECKFDDFFFLNMVSPNSNKEQGKEN